VRERVKRYGRFAVHQAAHTLAFGIVLGALSVLLLLLLTYRVWRRLQDGNDPMAVRSRRVVRPPDED
jgi:hypothetical protein